MTLHPGTRFGHYAVVTAIGSGGMGEVYRARDTRLDREVAVKVLPPAFTGDVERMARFEREAKVLASLNHPNVGQIYGLEEAEGAQALILELVEGPTLAERIAAGPVALDEALSIAGQIAAALEAAHERGIVHRDLKPANVKLRDDGTVKVLDFGLAKAVDAQPADEGDLAVSPTLTAGATALGVILGTAAYMSPEQARGKPVDRRADVWAFGAVLFEMLAGERPFPGDDVSQTLARVIDREPNWLVLPEVPPGVRRVLELCLRKDPRQRIRDVADARMALEGAFEPPIDVAATTARARRLDWPLAVAVALALVGIVSLVVSLGARRTGGNEPEVIHRFAVATEIYRSRSLPDVAISPDGRQVAYTANAGGVRQLMLRSLDQLAPAPLVVGSAAYSPFFSPDGEWLGFYDLNAAMLKRVRVDGGPVSTICDSGLESLATASWGDEAIVFATIDPASGLWSVGLDGGAPEALTTPDRTEGELDHLWPEVLPGGRAVIFTITTEPSESSRIAVHDLGSGEQRTLLRDGSFARYVESADGSGYLIYVVEGSLHAVRFDLDRLEVIGDSVPLPEVVDVKPDGGANLGLSRRGSLIYALPRAAPRRTLGWVDRVSGQMTAEVTTGAVWGIPRVSPDGTRIALTRSGESGEDVWIHDLASGREIRLSTGGSDRSPVWSADGSRVAFSSSRRRAVMDIYQRPADLSGESELLPVASSQSLSPLSYSRDGSVLVYGTVRPETLRDVDALIDGVPRTILGSSANELAARLSPDGAWLVYLSDAGGETQVYLQPFPEGGRVIPVSTGRGVEPAWAHDGSELFYRRGDQMIAVSVETEPELRVGDPVVLFEARYAFDPFGYANYDVSSDGQRFLMVRSEEREEEPALVLAAGWLAGVERLMR